jgi:hypothetical protein
MATYAKRLEAAESATKHLPGQDDLLRDYLSTDWAAFFSEVLAKPVPVVGRGRGLRAAQAAMTALPVSDLKVVLEWLEDSLHRQRAASTTE